MRYFGYFCCPTPQGVGGLKYKSVAYKAGILALDNRGVYRNVGLEGKSFPILGEYSIKLVVWNLVTIHDRIHLAEFPFVVIVYATANRRRREQQQSCHFSVPPLYY